MESLLLIDIQNDFLPGGALAVPEGDAIIPVVNRLLAYFEVIAATQDWHEADHTSFASNHTGRKPFECIKINGIDQTLWPDHCVQGTPGANFPSLLNTKPVQAIFRKGTHSEIDSYSGFFDNDHRQSTGLAGYLREKNVDVLYLVGLAGDVCVYATAMDSLQEGFRTCIIEDGTRALDAGYFKTCLQQFTSKGGIVIRSSEFHKIANP